ncbi:vacuolar transporter chaperone [Lithohypha guttulata]|nr:vacuolar transporter chaperone [Lithohypha guttulata]
MKLQAALSAVWLLTAACSAQSNITKQRQSRQILQADFQPPQVFENVNLVRTTNLEKGYVRETINVVVSNTDQKSQSEYYLPFEYDTIGRVGGIEVRDKKDAAKPSFNVRLAGMASVTGVDGTTTKPSQYFIVTFSEPLAPKAQLTLSISYYVLTALSPLPAQIHQNDRQYLTYSFSAYFPSAYPTLKQKTNVKLSSADVPDYTTTTGLTKGKDPEVQGTKLTYGPYDSRVEAGAIHPVTIRYEFTKPILVASLLERDIEVSHWGGNIALEERYWLRNDAATLMDNFNRVLWAQSNFYQGAPSSALKELKVPLKPGSADPYFTDDIGNVSTSRFRPSEVRDASLELKPRYPIFGGWKYSFKIGWNNALSLFVRKLKTPSDTYILSVPFLEGPKMSEGIQYERMEFRIILPEGSKLVKWETSGGTNLPVLIESQDLHKTFMDTVGRTSLTLAATNVVDELRDIDVLVSYEYTLMSALRKPLSIIAGFSSVFGQQLKQSLIKDYYWHYIDYDGLKESLKKPFENGHDGEREAWTDDDEAAFIRQLEGELDKVFMFQKLKSKEIIGRIKSSEDEVKQVVDRQEELNRASDADTDESLEEDFQLLEADLSDIIADVHDLAKYTQLNYTGFQKIIKKHDKQTSIALRPTFATRLKAKPFFQDNYDAFIVTLSRLYDLVRTRGQPIKGDSSAGEKQQNFVRQTTKYWVHADNITEVKLIILKHLPVLVFNPNKEFEDKDSAITSIYYDNTDTWELYEGRLKKTEGAEAIRLRWYGGMENETIFVERKTHREDWTGEKSVKARFNLKEKNVNAFMAGKMTVEEAFAKMRKEGKKGEKEIADLEQLAREIQYRVITRKLVPVTRSFYHRTAFQLPGDARVRISLDTELTMTREDNLDGRKRTGANWRRMDIGIDWPFQQLPAEDVERFPYAVLEVKLQTQAGQEPPQWVRDLTASHLVEAVPKFSKFIHGTATLFPNRINLLPYWFPQMDIDIRKPVTHRFGIERPGTTASYTTSDVDDDSEDEFAQQTGQGPPPRGIEQDEDEGHRRLHAARDALEQTAAERERDEADATANGDARAPGNSLDVEERIAQQPLVDEEYLYDTDEEESPDDKLEEARRSGGLHYYPLLLQHHVLKAGHAITDIFHKLPTTTHLPQRGGMGQVNPQGQPIQGTKRFKAPPGKKIHVPVRVEPKVYFATERTFLSWLEFSIILGSIAATLVNFGDNVSLASAWGFTVVAVAALLYSVVIYALRVSMIRKRRAQVGGRYYDKWGTSLLCVGLLAATAVSFGIRLKYGSDVPLKGDKPSIQFGEKKMVVQGSF